MQNMDQMNYLKNETMEINAKLAMCVQAFYDDMFRKYEVDREDLEFYFEHYSRALEEDHRDKSLF